MAVFRWNSESKSPHVDLYVRWAIADLSEDSARQKRIRERVAMGGTSKKSAPKRRQPKLCYSKDDEDELRKAVHRECVIEYRKSWGKDWRDEHADWVTGKYAEECRVAYEIEGEAEEALAGLRSALNAAQRLIGRLPIEGDATVVSGKASHTLVMSEGAIETLRSRLLHSPQPVSVRIGDREFAVVQTAKPPELNFAKLAKSELQRFVHHALTSKEYRHKLGCGRAPTADEMATIWVLSGGWPSMKKDKWNELHSDGQEGVSVEGVMSTVRANIWQAVKRVGEYWVPPGTSEQAIIDAARAKSTK